jgi:hypothetical protein
LSNHRWPINGVTPEWRRSARCETGACVEVAVLDEGIAMRDSKNPESGFLRFTKSEWSAFLKSIRSDAI